jgi:DNA polymerase-4
VLRLRFADFTRATRSHTLRHPTTETEVLLVSARELLGTAMPLIESRGITLLGVSLTNLQNDAPMQMALPFEERKPAALDAALDDVRDRFGSRSVTRAALLGRDPGISVPLLPD